MVFTFSVEKVQSFSIFYLIVPHILQCIVKNFLIILGIYMTKTFFLVYTGGASPWTSAGFCMDRCVDRNDHGGREEV